jgi:hypothetical protein
MNYFDPLEHPDLALFIDAALGFDPDTDPRIAYDLDAISEFERSDFDPDDPSVSHLLQYLEPDGGEE